MGEEVGVNHKESERAVSCICSPRHSLARLETCGNILAMAFKAGTQRHDGRMDRVGGVHVCERVDGPGGPDAEDRRR